MYFQRRGVNERAFLQSPARRKRGKRLEGALPPPSDDVSPLVCVTSHVSASAQAAGSPAVRLLKIKFSSLVLRRSFPENCASLDITLPTTTLSPRRKGYSVGGRKKMVLAMPSTEAIRKHFLGGGAMWLGKARDDWRLASLTHSPIKRLNLTHYRPAMPFGNRKNFLEYLPS